MAKIAELKQICSLVVSFSTELLQASPYLEDQLLMQFSCPIRSLRLISQPLKLKSILNQFKRSFKECLKSALWRESQPNNLSNLVSIIWIVKTNNIFATTNLTMSHHLHQKVHTKAALTARNSPALKSQIALLLKDHSQNKLALIQLDLLSNLLLTTSWRQSLQRSELERSKRRKSKIN